MNRLALFNVVKATRTDTNSNTPYGMIEKKSFIGALLATGIAAMIGGESISSKIVSYTHSTKKEMLP